MEEIFSIKKLKMTKEHMETFEKFQQFKVTIIELDVY